MKSFLIRKIKAVPHVDLFWSEHFSKIRELVDKLGVYDPILINFVINGGKSKKVLFNSVQMLIEKGLPYLFKDHETYYFKLPSVSPFHALHYLWKQPINNDRSPEQGLIEKFFYSRP